MNNKHIIYLLLLMMVGQYTYPHMHKLKIYRKPKVVSFLTVTAAEIVSISSLLFTKSVLDAEVRKKGRLDEVGWGIIGMLGVPSAIGTTISSAYLLSFCRWYARLHKPILIFDEEGFTYEKSRWLRGRKYVRYLWKDVVSHWSEGVVDQWGRQLKLKWCYHIDGEQALVEINVLELDIPREIRAKVESLRQGRVRALWCG